MRTATLSMAGEGQTYATTLGQSLLDLHWKVNCSLAGSKEWMQQPVPIMLQLSLW